MKEQWLRIDTHVDTKNVEQKFKLTIKMQTQLP